MGKRTRTGLTAMEKALRKAREKERKRLREACKCGETFGAHGSTPPHTIGDTCNGFASARTNPPGETGGERHGS